MSDLALTAAGNMLSGDYEARLRTAAAQFEAQFMAILLKESREGRQQLSDGGFFGDSPASKQFGDLFDSALAEQAAGGMGIADIVVEQIVRKQAGG